MTEFIDLDKYERTDTFPEMILRQMQADNRDNPLLFHGELTPWLAEAAKITTGDRRRDYGRPLLNFLRIAIRWSNYLNVSIGPDKVAMMMIDMKVAREQHTPKDDNVIDILGYASCMSDMHEHLRGMGYEDGIRIFNDMSVSGMQLLYERVLRDHNQDQAANAGLINTLDVYGNVDTVKSFLK